MSRLAACFQQTCTVNNLLNPKLINIKCVVRKLVRCPKLAKMRIDWCELRQEILIQIAGWDCRVASTMSCVCNSWFRAAQEARPQVLTLESHHRVEDAKPEHQHLQALTASRTTSKVQEISLFLHDEANSMLIAACIGVRFPHLQRLSMSTQSGAVSVFIYVKYLPKGLRELRVDECQSSQQPLNHNLSALNRLQHLETFWVEIFTQEVSWVLLEGRLDLPCLRSFTIEGDLFQGNKNIYLRNVSLESLENSGCRLSIAPCVIVQ